jgi:hypothetical protein
MPVILIPCLRIQNSSAGVASTICTHTAADDPMGRASRNLRPSPGRRAERTTPRIPRTVASCRGARDWLPHLRPASSVRAPSLRSDSCPAPPSGPADA